LPTLIEYVSGELYFDVKKHDLVVVCVVKNGLLYINKFIDHYTKIGAKHIVFLDNGSTDGTVEVAAGHRDVTILKTDAPFSTFKAQMRQYLISEFSGSGWVLCADIDEFLDYPYSNVIDINDFIGYLNKNNYNCVACHMLDLFPRFDLKSDYYHDFVIDSIYYDISNLRSKKYKEEPNNLDNEMKFYFGGIRKKVFNTDVALTKHKFVRLSGNLKARHIISHGIRNANIADVNCVLKHYKFTDKFIHYVRNAVREENYFDDSAEYKKYFQVWVDNEELRLKTDDAQKLDDVNELVENGFLTVSDDYKEFVKHYRIGRADD